MSVIYESQRLASNAVFDNYYVPVVPTLNSADLAAIADIVWANLEALTVAKFLGLK